MWPDVIRKIQYLTMNTFGGNCIVMLHKVHDKGFSEGNFTALFNAIELNKNGARCIVVLLDC